MGIYTSGSVTVSTGDGTTICIPLFVRKHFKNLEDAIVVSTYFGPSLKDPSTQLLMESKLKLLLQRAKQLAKEEV